MIWNKPVVRDKVLNIWVSKKEKKDLVRRADGKTWRQYILGLTQEQINKENKNK